MSNSFVRTTRVAAGALVVGGLLILGPAAFAQPYGKGGNHTLAPAKPAKPAAKPEAACKADEAKAPPAQTAGAEPSSEATQPTTVSSAS